MKHRLDLLAILLMAMAIPQSVKAYSFSAVAPSGQTLYYNIVNGNAQVTSQNSSGPYYSTYPTGVLVIPDTVTYNSTTYSVTSIGNYAFYQCRDLTSVTIGDSVTSIGNYAFYQCSNLTSVTIPNSVTSIGNYAFYQCSNLTSVTIPNSVTSIGGQAFQDVRHIVYYGTATGARWGAISMNGTVDGDFVFSSSVKDTLLAYIGVGGAVTIPNTVTTIGGKAFYYCSGLTSVTIGDFVTTIGNYAFGNCIGLTLVIIPNSVTSIGNSAFYQCSGLTSVTIGDSVTSIGNSAFYQCRGLTSVTIPNSVISIGGSAFLNCIGLTSVTIPNSVISIGGSAFRNCSGLTSATIGNSVTSIGTDAFRDCSSLTSVDIPNSVISIGNGAFRDCSGLTSIMVGSGNTVYDSRGNCNAIIKTSTNTLQIGCMNTVIPNSVTSIDSYAFCQCSGLTSVTIPNSVISIGYGAFEGCSGLTMATIGNSVTSIGPAAFCDCSSLTSVDIPNSVISIGGSAFRNCSGLISVTISNSVTRIDNYTFYGCSGLTSVTIGNSVTSIGTEAFCQCSGLTSVTIPSSVTSIGDRAFFYCTGLSEIICHRRTAPTLGIHDAFSDVTDSIIVYIPCGSMASYQSSSWNRYFSNFSDTVFLYTLNVQSDNATYGTVTVTTVPTCSDNTAVISATPMAGYHFDHWSDGDTATPRTLIVTCDTTLTAVFVANQYTVTLEVNDTLMGHVTGAGVYNYDDTATLYAEAFPGYHFTYWDDGDTNNPRTLTVDHDTMFIAFFAVNQYMVIAEVNDTLMGHVIGAGVYNYGDTATLYAETFPGYHFAQWGDGDTTIPRTLVVTQDTTIVAFFREDSDTTAIRETEENHGDFRVFSHGGQIVVEGTEEMPVMLYDATGRLLATRRSEAIPGPAPLRIDVPASGTYLIKVGNYPARKVVVIR